MTAVQQREACVRHRSTLLRRIGVANKALHLSTCLAASGVAGLEVLAGDQSEGKRGRKDEDEQEK